jgi:hypothetical protein
MFEQHAVLCPDRRAPKSYTPTRTGTEHVKSRVTATIWHVANTTRRSLHRQFSLRLLQLAMAWTVRGSNRGRSKTSSPKPSRPTPRLFQPTTEWVTVLFAGDKADGAWNWTFTPSSAEVKNASDYRSVPPNILSWRVQRNCSLPFRLDKCL